ncbi:TauD/TfdA-like domain [Dillenia turbinata]|uniref:TauD/TfdA-like domain n=1 Tax=Dillenia turbinata TaxID=194707 RepID=A0AAN8V0U8_9MAGN
MEFVPGRLEEERVFDGVVFPKTLKPPGEEYGANELVEMIKEKHEWVCDQLRLHSAILFRGFNVSSAEEFGAVVEAFGWDEMGYVGATTRLKAADRVYTANEAPLHQLINFHHEMALIKKSPSKIFFYCLQPSPEGGETSIVPSNIVVKKMEENYPDLMSKMAKWGIVFHMKTSAQDDSETIISKTWKWLFKTEDEVEAKKRAKEMLTCSSVGFGEDGSADFTYGPLNPIKEFGGKRVWFTPILGYTDDEVGLDMTFGDGSAFSVSDFEAYKKTLSALCVDIKWERGDILLLDNLSVQHARRPGKPPRVILTLLCGRKEQEPDVVNAAAKHKDREGKLETPFDAKRSPDFSPSEELVAAGDHQAHPSP